MPPCVLGRVLVLYSALPWAWQAKRKRQTSESGWTHLLGSKFSHSSNKTAGKRLQRVPFLCSLWYSGLFCLGSSLPHYQSLLLYSEGGVLMLASCSSSWSGKSWRPWAPWSCGHARQRHSLLSEAINKKKKNNRFCDVQITSTCPLCVHWDSNHGFHLRVDRALLQPVACLFLLKHLWLPWSPPCAPVLLNTHRPQSRKAPTHTPTIIASVNYRVCEASIRAKAIAAVIRRRGGGLHGDGRGFAIAPQTHSDGRRLERQFLRIRMRSKNQVICGIAFLIDSYIKKVEKNPCIFNLKAQLEDVELKKSDCPSLIWKALSETAGFNTIVEIFIFFAQLVWILHYRSTRATHFIAYKGHLNWK